jgi:hypothetical protein
MQVVITHLHNSAVENFRGEPDQISAQLLTRFPWLSYDPYNPNHSPQNFPDIIARLAAQQNIHVKVM